MTADEYAKSIGYYGAGDAFTWHGMQCRDVVMTEDPREIAPRTGLPIFIVKTGDEWRECTEQESYDYIFE